MNAVRSIRHISGMHEQVIIKHKALKIESTGLSGGKQSQRSKASAQIERIDPTSARVSTSSVCQAVTTSIRTTFHVTRG
jgi:hypothetical protein